MHIYIYIHTYIRTYMHAYIHTYMHAYIGSFVGNLLGWGLSGITVSFYNFKSQNFKLSVSNPKSKYVAYLSVLYQISNCQGLGRKNKH